MLRSLRGAGTVASIVALSAAVAVALLTIVAPKLMGAAPYSVLTGSMRPAMEPGSLVIVRPVDPADIRIGDVITYQLHSGRPEVVTHRVVGIAASSGGERTFTTQGDANSTPDAEPVMEVQVRGRVAYMVPWLGHVNSAIHSATRSNLLIVAAVGLIGYGLWQVGNGWRARRSAGRGTTSPASADSPSPSAASADSASSSSGSSGDEPTGPEPSRPESSRV